MSVKQGQLQFAVPAGFEVDGKYILYSAGQGTVTLGRPRRYPLFQPPTLPTVPCLTGCLTAASVGDPHLVTMDGQAYDLQTVGESIFVQSGDGTVVVQTRTAPYKDRTTVSYNVAAAAQVGAHRVGFYVGEGIRIDDVLTEVPDGESLDLGNGAYLSRVEESYVLAWPGTGDRPRLDVTLRAYYLNLKFAAPTSMAGTFTGLLGDADGDRGNDIVRRDGTVLTAPVTAQVLHTEFADSWRITDTESLFTYPAGEGTGDYTDLTFPSSIAQLADFDPAVVAAARIQCEQAGITHPILRDNCALDLIITQDPSFLTGFLGAVLPQGRSPLNTVRDSTGAAVIVPGTFDIAASPDGDTLYLSVTDQNKIITLDPITGAVADYAVVDAPTFMHMNMNGDLYVVTRGIDVSNNVGNGTVTKIDAATKATTVVGSSLRLPAGVAVGSDGTLYVIQTGYNYFGEPWNPRLTTVDGDVHTIISSWGVNTNSNERWFDLDIDSGDKLWWYAKSNANTIRSWEAGVTTNYATFGSDRFLLGGDDVMYYSNQSGPFSGCDARNTSTVSRRDLSVAGVVGAAEVVAGGSQGFTDSTFDSPVGELCGDDHAMAWGGGRLYIRDEGNDAVRYLVVG